VRDLEHALLAFEVMGESRRAAFEQAVDRYVAGYLEHMAVEENEILPAAQQLLTAADWADLDAAFAANRDPLTGHEPADEYRELFHTIVNNAPAPIGLGGGSQDRSR
jgi:hemerythrin-like domain-containing protein